MNGYALRSADVESVLARLKKAGVSKAGARFEGELPVGAYVRIFAGATLPRGADTIALQENAIENDDYVEIRRVPNLGRHIHSAGMDFSIGQTSIPRGRIVSARDIGVIASSGYARIAVRRKPALAYPLRAMID
jgi:molybdopterin molybdotransferase